MHPFVLMQLELERKNEKSKTLSLKLPIPAFVIKGLTILIEIF